MGYSGLIYAAIVAAWLAVLVPRWVRRNEEVERARETDAASGVRVLARRSGPIHAPHRTAAEGANSRVIISADPAGLAPAHTQLVDEAGRETAGAGDETSAADAGSDGRTVAHPRPDPVVNHEVALRRLEDTFAQAAKRRRRILAVLLTASLVSLATTFAGAVPAWAPALVGSGLVGFLMLARGAAVEQERRRTALRRKIRQRAGAGAGPPPPRRPPPPPHRAPRRPPRNQPKSRRLSPTTANVSPCSTCRPSRSRCGRTRGNPSTCRCRRT
jgi:hypothetical protein